MVTLRQMLDAWRCLCRGEHRIGTRAGFLTGIYLPISLLPGPVQWAVERFPSPTPPHCFGKP